MRIAVTAPCLFPSTDPCHYCRDSALKFSIPLQFHGVGTLFIDWKRMLMESTLPTFYKLFQEGYTHVLYVDGRDTLFTSGMEEILSSYALQGSPRLLISSDHPQLLNAGGYIAEIPWFTNLMLMFSRKYEGDGDYQNWLINEWPIDGGVIDEGNHIFQTIDTPHPAFISPILHFRGGYADPKTGRDERMKPFAELIGL